MERWWNDSDRGKVSVERWWNDTDRGKVSVERWWNDTDRGGKMKDLEKYVCPCYFVRHKTNSIGPRSNQVFAVRGQTSD